MNLHAQPVGPGTGAAVGGPYDYDVFFSYAWAEDQTNDPDLRDWCRAVATQICKLLRVRFNSGGTPFRHYLDRDAARAGQDLGQVIQGATQRCAVFVAMVSGYYKTDWCTKELNWFCDQLAADGAIMADRVYIMRVQHGDEEGWPARLAGSDGRPLLYQDFCDKLGLPLDFAEFIGNGTVPNLSPLIMKAAVEIADKLSGIKARLQAQTIYAQRIPEDPILFFEAEPADAAVWQKCRVILNEAEKSIVKPVDAAPIPATAPEDWDQIYDDCDGLVLLRSRTNDDLDRRINRAYLDRRHAFRAHKKEVPWVLLDEIDAIPASGTAFRIPRVALKDGWVDELHRALFGGTGPARDSGVP